MSNSQYKPINYDDEDEGDEGGGEEIYHRLERPDNLHEMMTQQEPVERGGHRGRGGVQRGRGGQGGNDRGKGRGGNRSGGGGGGNRGVGNFQRDNSNDRGNKRGGFGRGRGQHDHRQNGSRNQSPQQGANSNKRNRDFSHSPRPGSGPQQRYQHRHEEALNAGGPQAGQPAFPPGGMPLPPMPLDPAAFASLLPPGAQFNPAQFSQNLMQTTNGFHHSQQQQSDHNSRRYDHAPPSPQQQWQAPPPLHQFHGQQGYQAPPHQQQHQQQQNHQPYSGQYGQGQGYPSQNGLPSFAGGQIDVAALLRNLQNQGAHQR